MQNFVYLDNAATTPLDQSVLEAMLPLMREPRGNPSSLHALGAAARTRQRSRHQLTTAVRRRNWTIQAFSHALCGGEDRDAR